jgi:hypothetical protein
MACQAVPRDSRQAPVIQRDFGSMETTGRGKGDMDLLDACRLS